eukprot:m.225265 g.225265  ORF g.225265 m.225265 type:complete len:360 (-) comp16653_c0_seq1:362-1441(-)
MATVQKRPSPAFPGSLAQPQQQNPFTASLGEPDFFAAFDSLPQFELPEFSSSSSSAHLPQQTTTQNAAMDFQRALQFDQATLDQLMASAGTFLPDLENPVGDFAAAGSAFPDTNDYSTGSSPRDDQSHTSGDLQDAPLKSASGAIIITEEEREMLAASGVVIPTDAITLTKAEEKALKSVRRRLRNKISAQDSRRKKKEYVDGLEQRVASCTAVNIEMQTKVATLAHENRTLRQQLQQLKEMVARLGGPQSAATTGTLLMVLALSFSMFVNPLASSVAANATVPDTPLPSATSRTLKALPVVAEPAVPPQINMASLRDTLSNLLFNSQQANPTADEDEEQRVADRQAPPSLAPLRRKAP